MKSLTAAYYTRPSIEQQHLRYTQTKKAISLSFPFFRSSTSPSLSLSLILTTRILCACVICGTISFRSWIELRVLRRRHKGYSLCEVWWWQRSTLWHRSNVNILKSQWDFQLNSFYSMSILLLWIHLNGQKRKFPLTRFAFESSTARIAKLWCRHLLINCYYWTSYLKIDQCNRIGRFMYLMCVRKPFCVLAVALRGLNRWNDANKMHFYRI